MSGEKTELPTPKKLRDARKKGQVLKSKEIVSTALILSITSMMMVMSDYYFEHFHKIIIIPEVVIDLPFSVAFSYVVKELTQEFIYLCTPILAISALIVIASHIAQYGFLFSGEAIKPSLKKINPVEGAKKIFSIKSLMEFTKSIIKVGLLSLLVWVTIEGNMQALLHLPECGITCIIPVLGSMLAQLMAVCSIGFIVIAIADYAFERYQHIKQLRMSKDEVKREYKEMEGSPEIKGKRRQFHQELQSSNMRADVKRSSVIIANPTHLAIGIRYERGETPLPLVTLKFNDAQALRIQKIAKEEGIPVLQRIPLARALYQDAQINNYIPAAQIEATAEVLRWLEQWRKNEGASNSEYQ